MSKITEGVRQVIESIVRMKGGCTTEDLLDAARDPESPAHSAFEWDDSVAAEEFRKYQARKLISFTFISVEKKPPQPMRWVPMPRDEAKGTPGTPPGIYRPLSYIYERPDEWKRAVDYSVQHLKSAQRYLQDLYDYAEAHQEVEDRRVVVKEAIGLFENIYQIIGQMHSPGVQPQTRM